MSCNSHAAPPVFTCLEVPILEMSASDQPQDITNISGSDNMSMSYTTPIHIRESALNSTAIPSTSKKIR